MPQEIQIQFTQEEYHAIEAVADDLGISVEEAIKALAKEQLLQKTKNRPCAL